MPIFLNLHDGGWRLAQLSALSNLAKDTFNKMLIRPTVKHFKNGDMCNMSCANNSKTGYLLFMKS